MINTDDLLNLVRKFANLGQDIEKYGRECPLCDYIPSSRRKKDDAIYVKHCNAEPEVIVDDEYPHQGHDGCLIAQAMQALNDNE
ncbi:MAG TPA: hypothetical protein VI423_02155 [Paenisporosarcina sp.]|nr:hypothetical protein [Paenisporosarcina sp.]